MPYSNEHAARIRDPGLFEPTSFRSKDLKGGVRIIIGKLKTGNGSMITQAYRFSVDQFTPEEAKKWLKDNKVSYMKFEPAKKESEEEAVSHTGVKGMKWGVRKDKSTNLSPGTVKLKKGGGFSIAVKKGKPFKPNDSSHHKIYATIRKKKVKDMTDEELKFATKRASLISLYKKSGALTKKKVRQMSNDELQGHANKYLLRKGILKNPVRKWKIKDFVKTYKLSDTEAKTLLDRVNTENAYYDQIYANVRAGRKYVGSFLDTNP